MFLNWKIINLRIRSFGTHFARVCVEGDIEEKLQKVCGDFERNVDEFLFQGSGWVVHKPLYIDAEFSECRPLAGAGCGLHLATYLRGTGVGNTTVINDENEECFYFAVAASFLGTNANVSELKDFIQQNLVKLSKVRGGGKYTFCFNTTKTYWPFSHRKDRWQSRTSLHSNS